MNLSVIIITKNEEKMIQRCLNSVRWASEIIIVDSGSSDNTIDICKTYTSNIYITDWPGFGIQKNRALEKATGDWVLSIDADEWLSEALISEIKQTLNTTRETIYTIPRKTQYMGEWIRHGDIGRDHVVRLFKRGVTKFTDDVVHESLITKGHHIAKLKHFLFHDSYSSVEELLDRMNHYTTLSSNIRYQKNIHSSLTKAITFGLWAFFKSYILRLGFLDGRIGFVAAVSSAESSYYRHLKLLYRHRNEKD